MSTRCACFVLPIVLLALTPGGAADGAFNPLTDPAFAGWWSFDEGTGTTAADLSTFGRDGTLRGGATWTTGRRWRGGSDQWLRLSPSFQLTTDSITMVLGQRLESEQLGGRRNRPSVARDVLRRQQYAALCLEQRLKRHVELGGRTYHSAGFMGMLR